MTYHNLLKKCYQKSAQLVAVSKGRSEEAILSLYDQGQRVFAENRMPELVEKVDTLPSDIKWHFIGNIQSKKVKYIVPHVSMIHSVDSWKLLELINKESAKKNKITDCLLQLKVAQETSKSGLIIGEGLKVIDQIIEQNLDAIRLCGIMGMATFTDDERIIRGEFKELKLVFETLKEKLSNNQRKAFKEISMGMSGDYKIALEEGSTMVRVGSLLFSD